MKLDDVNPSKVTLVNGADVPEAFIQQDIKKGEDGQSLLIKHHLIGLSLEATKMLS